MVLLQQIGLLHGRAMAYCIDGATFPNGGMQPYHGPHQ
jgi:hypothetical protein